MPQASETLLIADLEKRLLQSYSQVPVDRVRSAVQNARARFTDSPIRDFIPLLVERRARAQLDHATTDTSMIST